MSDSHDGREFLPVRPQPCSTCPYRVDTPPGVWDRSEYEKLRAYDRETFAQPPAAFLCHHSHDEGERDQLCRGWLAVGGWELLAVRLALVDGGLDPAELDRPVVAELYPSGTAAADAGCAAVDRPGSRAEAAIARLIAARQDG